MSCLHFAYKKKRENKDKAYTDTVMQLSATMLCILTIWYDFLYTEA